MKKTILIGLLLILVGAAQAQITIWEKYYKSKFNFELCKMDTLGVVGYPTQFQKGEIDSITLRVNSNILLWKNGQQIDWNKYGYVYPHNVANLDSISFVRYTTDSIWFMNGGTETIYLQNMTDTFKGSCSCPIRWNPYFSFDSLEYELSNPEVVSISECSSLSLDGRFVAANKIVQSVDWYGNVYFDPIKKGETELTVRCGKVKTTKRIVVEDIDTTISASAESLFQIINNPSTFCGPIDIEEGTTGFYRGIWNLNEMPADHIWWVWDDYGIPALRTHKWDADNNIIQGMYRRLYYNIDLCNQYLQVTQSDTTKTSERAEVRFMRAFYYSYLLDLFGNVPIITKHVQKDLPVQNTRKQVFQFVVGELEQAAKDMPEPGYRATNYRADKAAAWLLLSRVYLNSEVYCGLSYMDKAAEYAYKVIKCPYKLSSNYQNLFMGDNNERYFSVGNDAVQEIILSIEQNSSTARYYGGSMFLIAITRSSGMPNWGLSENWYCARSKTNLVQAFTTLQNAATIKAANTAKALGDDRAIFCSYCEGADGASSWNLLSNARTGNASYFYDCWAITKYTNLGASSSYAPGDKTWPDMDIPIMRKAEAYLTYAEAVLRGGTVQSGYTALSAVNELRTRAHATPFETISLAELLNEWAREFYAEGRRRMDLIRFGAFSGQNTYNWEGKNGQNGTTATTIDAHYNLYPIPQDMINWNPNLTQNPGY